MGNLNICFEREAANSSDFFPLFDVALAFSVEDEHYGKSFPVKAFCQNQQIYLSGFSSYSEPVSLSTLVANWEDQICEVNRNFASDRRNKALEQARGRRIHSIFETACELTDVLRKISDERHPHSQVILDTIELIRPFVRPNGDIYHKVGGENKAGLWGKLVLSLSGLERV